MRNDKREEDKEDSRKQNEEEKQELIEIKNEELGDYINYYEKLMKKRLRVNVDQLREQTIK